MLATLRMPCLQTVGCAKWLKSQGLLTACAYIMVRTGGMHRRRAEPPEAPARGASSEKTAGNTVMGRLTQSPAASDKVSDSLSLNSDTP